MTHYQNGLCLTHTTSDEEVGRVFCRWTVEFLSKVVGWTIVDKFVGTKWDNYYGSGAATAVVNDAETLTITSPSYAFSSADNERYLTLTGFTTGELDGCYRILEYISSVGNDYTLTIDKRMGPHSDGLPLGETADWALWGPEDTTTPDVDDVIVLGAKGHTGAGSTAGNGTGDSISMVGTTATLTDAEANFQTTDVGKDITIPDAINPGNNGTFTIASRVSATQITYTNAAGVNETSSFAWQITYTYHYYFKVLTGGYNQFALFPEVSVSPFASWVPGVGWSDGRYTAPNKPSTGATGMGYPNLTVVYAVADEFNFTSIQRTEDVDKNRWFLYQAGEIDALYPDKDPRPVVASAGNCGYFWEGKDLAIVGRTCKYDTQYQTWVASTRGLSWDETTTLTYFMSIPTGPTYDYYQIYSWIHLQSRLHSEWSQKQYRLQIVLESRTSGHNELRGVFRDAWITAHCSRGMALLKQGSDWYLHMRGGWLLPWNGAKNWYPLTDWTPGG